MDIQVVVLSSGNLANSNARRAISLLSCLCLCTFDGVQPEVSPVLIRREASRTISSNVRLFVSAGCTTNAPPTEKRSLSRGMFVKHLA